MNKLKGQGDYPSLLHRLSSFLLLLLLLLINHLSGCRKGQDLRRLKVSGDNTLSLTLTMFLVPLCELLFHNFALITAYDDKLMITFSSPLHRLAFWINVPMKVKSALQI